MEFLENTALHLVGGLVGEGHGKDVPVGMRIAVRFPGKKQSYVFAGQSKGLSGAGRCLEYLQHDAIPPLFST